ASETHRRTLSLRGEEIPESRADTQGGDLADLLWHRQWHLPSDCFRRHSPFCRGPLAHHWHHHGGGLRHHLGDAPGGPVYPVPGNQSTTGTPAVACCFRF